MSITLQCASMNVSILTQLNILNSCLGAAFPNELGIPSRRSRFSSGCIMRFRCKVADVVCLNNFTRVVNTITKLTKACALRLTVDNLYLILTDKVANGGVSMWCELSQGNFFDEYQMEGVSAEQNEIYLELVPENLSRALKMAQNAKTVKIKLTNKQSPCLTVAVELVSIYLPALKTMKNVVERMKNLSNFMVIEANGNGVINLKIETDLVSVSTHFKDLGNPPWACNKATQNSTQEKYPDKMSEARVDIRKLLQFLAGQQVNPTKAICNISHERMVHFLLMHEEVSLQYFIPAHA